MDKELIDQRQQQEEYEYREYQKMLMREAEEEFMLEQERMHWLDDEKNLEKLSDEFYNNKNSTRL